MRQAFLARCSNQRVQTPLWQTGVYTWKSDEDGRIVRGKTRLVARDFRQREGIYYGETFPSTPASSYIRLIVGITCERDLDVCRFDTKQAFVQSEVEKDVFVRLPGGYDYLSDKVIRLNHSLYGLKQTSLS